MAMSKKFAKMRHDKRAEMGVGTMIIFIAMVLVAAVAASVLISTANTVREQATQTGNDAITNVASGFDIKYVKGTVAEGENVISSMDIFVQLSAGSPALRMSDVIISITAGITSSDQVYAGHGVDEADPDEYPIPAAPGLKDVDTGETISLPTYSATLVPPAGSSDAFYKYGTVAQGDLVKITVNFLAFIAEGEEDDEAKLAIEPGDYVQIKIMPARGSATTVSFTVPPVLNEGTVNLR